ncbi:hypothetical protein M8J77_021625 [Diaphorina citri]|nr:hypothetical protein M8J77_021625 [Diaphorina citri]
MNKRLEFDWRINISVMIVLYLRTNLANNEDLPKYLQDMIANYRAKQSSSNHTTEIFPTVDLNEYFYNPVHKTTHYLDRYPTGSQEVPFDMDQINMFTMFPDDSELVYTGPTMDPSDLLGPEGVNTDGWRHFEVDGKLGPISCPVCKKKFKKEESYYKHILTVENMTTPAWFIRDTYTCAERYKAISVTCPDQMCGTACKSFGDLRIHLLECHNGLPHNWNLTSDEYVRDVIKRNEATDRSEYMFNMSRTKRPYVRRTNMTHTRRTRAKNITQSTRMKRKYVTKQPRGKRPKILNAHINYTIIDEDFGKNRTGWLNEYT